MIRAVTLGALGVLTAIVAVIVIAGGGDDGYAVRMDLPNAGGLREGSAVKVAGATVGSVERLKLEPRDRVGVTLRLDHGVRVRRGVTAAIRSANLLGEKFVDLSSPAGGAPLPSGTVVPPARVTAPVDLDQVLSVLDADTRTRLAILINESGLALTGREVDLNTTLAQLPAGFDRVTALLHQVTSDNQALGRLVDEVSPFVHRLGAQRRDLTRLVSTAGAGLETVAARRRELRATIAAAPGTLTSLRRVLADLRQTTTPLEPAAEALSRTAPALRTALAQLEPFRAAAKPALNQATAVAPLLGRLGREATPVVRTAVPTAAALDTFASGSTPATQALDAGIDDALGAVQGWARAVQGRDSIGHLFRGHLSVTPEAIKSILERLQPAAPARKGQSGPPAGKSDTSPGAAPSPAPSAPGRPAAPKQPGPDLPKAVGDLLDKLVPGLGKQPPTAPKANPVTSLLDFLLKP